MAKLKTESFLARVTQHQRLAKTVPWPTDPEAQVRLRVLSLGDLETCYLDAKRHFASNKAGVKDQEAVFVLRERVELLFRALSIPGTGNPSDPGSWEPIATSADELAGAHPDLVAALYSEWSSLQSSVAPAPRSQHELDELVEALKKNTQQAPLAEWPSSLLSALVRTLVAQLPSSTLASSGS